MQLKIKSKKGLGMEFIITTSLVLISFFLIAGLFGRFTSKTSDLEAELLCQNSITQRARTALNVDWDVGGVSLFRSQVKSIPTICRTIDKKVSGTKEQILRQVADNMARCWWMFGEGRYEDILDSADASLFPEVFGLDDFGPNQCFNCYAILVDQEEIDGGSITGEELDEYLSKNIYAKVNKTYSDYIQGYKGPGRIIITVPEIQPRQAYAISMMPKKQGESTFWTKVLLSVSTPGQIYLLYKEYQEEIGKAYDEREVSSVLLGSLEKAQELCGDGDIAGQ